MTKDSNKDDLISLFYNRSLQTFLVLCQTKSFTKAAERLEISQSAVTQNIKTLEDRLSVTLLDRSTRPLKLTQDGVFFRQALEKSKYYLIDSVELLRSRNYLKPTLRIGVLDSIAKEIAPNLLKALSSHARQVSLRSGGSDHLIRLLQSDEVDLVIIGDAYKGEANLVRELILAEPTIVMLPKTIEKTKENWTWESLQRSSIPIVRLTKDSASGQITEFLLNQVKLEFPHRWDVDTIELVNSLVESGMGWCLTHPLSTLSLKNKLDSISLIPAPLPMMWREVYVVSKKHTNQEWVNLLTKIVTQLLEEKLLPEIYEKMPWLKGQMKLRDIDQR